jgi:Concanavalin A-like lectin/glucanases superfamily
MTKGFAGIVGAVACALTMLFASGASGATLIGDYQLQNTLASSGAGPALTKVGGGTSQFQSDNVMGSSRQVLAFPVDSGVQISPAGVGTGSYSVVTTFKFDNVAHYERILDQTIGTQDAGLYVSGDAIDPTRGYLAYYYDGGPPYVLSSTDDVFANSVYATTAVVVAPPSLTSVYVNGVLQFSPVEGRTPINDTLRLFKDDASDESPGAVSCIRLYSGALSPAEVAGIGASPTCGTVASAPAPIAKKKCKKHKKKHRAADAKKKKCKKRKKR